MVNLKKYPVALKLFGLILTFSFAVSCTSEKYAVTKVEGREIGVAETAGQDRKIEDFIKPYRENIDKDMSVVLAYSPNTLDKSGQWQCTIGNLMADVAKDFGNRVFQKRENKTIDICLLNYGGIRSILPKGNVTTRTAFEIMPFENSLVVAEMKGAQIREIVDYFIADRKAHPISGLTFTIASGSIATNISINGKPLEMDKTYYVVTSDYLIHGGDKMDFFKKSLKNYDLDYKLRNVLIDYFKEIDTIPLVNDQRIHISY